MELREGVVGQHDVGPAGIGTDRTGQVIEIGAPFEPACLPQLVGFERIARAFRRACSDRPLERSADPRRTEIELLDDPVELATDDVRDPRKGPGPEPVPSGPARPWDEHGCGPAQDRPAVAADDDHGTGDRVDQLARGRRGLGEGWILEVAGIDQQGQPREDRLTSGHGAELGPLRWGHPAEPLKIDLEQTEPEPISCRHRDIAGARIGRPEQVDHRPGRRVLQPARERRDQRVVVGGEERGGQWPKSTLKPVVEPVHASQAIDDPAIDAKRPGRGWPSVARTIARSDQPIANERRGRQEDVEGEETLVRIAHEPLEDEVDGRRPVVQLTIETGDLGRDRAVELGRRRSEQDVRLERTEPERGGQTIERIGPGGARTDEPARP